jgi:hypothetical protein
MRQDPNPVPRPRASYEQIAHQPDQDQDQEQQAPAGQPKAGQPKAGQPKAGQPKAGQPKEWQPKEWQPKAWQAQARRSPAWQPPDRQPSFRPASHRQAPPIYPAAQRPRLPGHAHEDSGYGGYGAYDAPPAHVNGWQGMPKPRPGDQETEATLARIRGAQRKARRMQTVCVLLGACAAAIFLAAVASHQLDGHIEMVTPVLLLTSTVNFRRYAQRAAKYRAAEADILAQVR